MSQEAADQIRAWLVEPEHIRSQREPLPLDRKQKEIADRRTTTGYLRLRGPAGSGKTHVLASKAAKLSLEGKQVLFITFNITLMNYIRDLIVRASLPHKGVLKNIELHSFHSWCKTVCVAAGYEVEYNNLWSSDEHSNRRTLDEGLASLTSLVLEERRKLANDDMLLYDALVVDEGQDFRLSWWLTLVSATKEGAERVLAADITQDIYGTAQAWTDEAMSGAGFRGPWSELKTAYRLPPEFVPYVREFAEGYLPASGRDIPEENQRRLGSELHLRWIQTTKELLESTTAKIILEMPTFTAPSSVAFSDVTFLCDSSKVGWDVVGELGKRGVKVAHTFEKDEESARRAKRSFYMGAEKVKGTTIHSFKGWESRFLVICISKIHSKKDFALLYIALTRLKEVDFGGSYISVITSAEELRDYGSTWSEG